MQEKRNIQFGRNTRRGSWDQEVNNDGQVEWKSSQSYKADNRKKTAKQHGFEIFFL